MPSPNRLLGVASSIVLFMGLLAFIYTSWNPDYANVSPMGSTQFSAPSINTWAELSESEGLEVFTFLHDKYPHLNLTKDSPTGLENHINLIEVLRPNKTDALSYLADNGQLPQRWAKAAITQFIDGESYIIYYKVGPLPISESSVLSPLENIYNSGRNYVKNVAPSFRRSQQWGMDLASNISDITWELLGAVKNPQDINDPEGLLMGGRPVFVENGSFVYWMSFHRPGAHSNARSILPQGLYIKIDAIDQDSEDWEILSWYYNGVFYDTADDIRAAIKSKIIVKTPPNLDGDWTEVEDFESNPHGRDMAPPIMVQPQGPRYRLDREQKYVSWMGFEFYIASAQSTGPALFDIRFRGQQIMYELGLQEAMAHYAGDDPIQGGQEFLDTFFGMGKYAFELVPGYDCPAYADYLSTTFHQNEEAKTNPNSICVFEYTADSLLQRHTAQYHVTVSKNTYLIVRFVSTVGNYDYTIDYMFYLDGSIEVKVRASGFIFAAFYTQNSDKKEDHYGYRIHDAAATSMHDHVINFKADIDVAGTANDMVRIAVEPTTREYPWEQPEIPVRNTMQLVEHAVTQETGIDWPKNSGEMYAIYHASATNKWGERRGYRITPGTGMGTPPHLTIENSTSLGKSARWAEHDVWVLRRKDSEPKSADPLNYLEPHDPLTDFTKMANGESLVQDDEYDGDLVLYFNLGAHHVPHSGDIPNTLMHTSASSVMFVPHNFNDRDPSRETVQGVRLDLKGGNGAGWVAASTGSELRARVGRNAVGQREVQTQESKAHYFGARYDKGVALEVEDLEPDLTSYDTQEHAVTDLGFNRSVLGIWQ